MPSLERLQELYRKLLEENELIPLKVSYNEEAIKWPLKIIGISGSRGKSSVAYIIHQYLKAAGHKAVLYSSIEIDSPLSFKAPHEAVENPLKDSQMLLDAINEAVHLRAEYLILEVNERAISKGITKNIPFDIRILTGIIPKQNDIFYDNYVAIKRKFIEEADENTKIILSLSDIDTVELYQQLSSSNVITCTSRYLAKRYLKEYEKTDYLLLPSTGFMDSMQGLNFTIKTEASEYPITTEMLMPYNAQNITTAIACLDTLGIFDILTFESFIRPLTVPGRDEVIRFEGRTVIISVNLVPQLEILKKYQTRGEINKITVVTGATGRGYTGWTSEFDEELHLRDRSESTRFAYHYLRDYTGDVYITTTDSGSSDKMKLLNQQARLLEGIIPAFKELNRARAIEQALLASNEGDVIYISGRGNRRVMCDSASTIQLHQDKEVVEHILKKMNKRSD